jgi:hypothetical protein
MSNTKAFLLCARTVSASCARKAACISVWGSTQAPFSTLAAPAPRSRRHSATRALEGPRELSKEEQKLLLVGGLLRQQLLHDVKTSVQCNTYYTSVPTISP